MNKEIFLIRHGRTEYNRLGIWQGSGVDSSLDELGQMQAEKFFKHYRDQEFDIVFHSNLRRSKETIQPFINDGVLAVESPLIREISWGHFEGHPHTEESIDTYKKVVGGWSRDEYELRFPGGESARDLEKRLTEFVESLRQLKQEKVLICSHGRAIRGLLCVMRAEPLKEMEKYQHENTGLFYAVQSGSSFNFLKLNNTDHL
jgi:probable phosphoglycerate mutase